MKKFLFTAFSLLVSLSIFSQVALPNLFSDNMVLQRNVRIPVWGWASANEKILVRFNKQAKSIKADKNGKWMVNLAPEKAGGPYCLVIKGKNTLRIHNILVGEVWLCSGQSNMEFTVGNLGGWQSGVANYRSEIAAANYPLIRQVKILHSINSLPETNLNTTGWKICDSTTVADFSGVAYFFAKNLCDSLNIPIGLINDCWGGTNIETWISREGFENSNEFREMIAGMPKISLDSLNQLKAEATLKRIEVLQGINPRSVHANLFKEFAFDDTRWPELYEPQLWEQQCIGEIDGVVWLRKTIVLTKEDACKNAVLELSTIDDEDSTYINGVLVGSTNLYSTPRKYAVANGLLKEGRNIIAVRVLDTGGGGGIYGEPAEVRLTLGSKTIPLAGQWKFQVASVQEGTNQNSLPSLCYNSMIAPLIPYAFRGVLWYQGEANANRAFQYRKAFPLLIQDWRQKWQEPDMPFYYVQLATYNTPGNSNDGCAWAELREAQTRTLSVSNTGMCVTTDIGNPTNIHPVNKQDVGKRLAAIAFNAIYNKKMICSGPAYQSMEIKGNEIMLSFDHIGTGLYTPDKYGYLKGFEIAGSDHVFYFAKAFIKDNQVVLSSEKVSRPIAVHYGWVGDASDCNLYNKEGFPAIPFRTDEWKTQTKGEKYTIDVMKH